MSNELTRYELNHKSVARLTGTPCATWLAEALSLPEGRRRLRYVYPVKRGACLTGALCATWLVEALSLPEGRRRLRYVYPVKRGACLTGALCAILFALSSLLVFPVPSLAQGKEYLIGPRDVITITIFAGGEKQQEVDLTVSGQGIINVPFIGPVKAEGLTIPQLESIIIKPLAEEFFVDPEVNIQIKEYHSLQYYISGAVKTPGLYEMTSEASLMELIAKAGGVLPERGNVAYILRESTNNLAKGEDIEDLMSSREPIKVDLKSLLDKGDMTYNLLLQSGDVIYIPLEKALNLAESNIYVEGEVKKPGVYSYQPGLTALNACIMAGGFADFAAPNRTKIIRNTEEGPEIIRINLNDVKEGRIPDVELQPGDRINVPETWL